MLLVIPISDAYIYIEKIGKEFHKGKKGLTFIRSLRWSYPTDLPVRS